MSVLVRSQLSLGYTFPMGTSIEPNLDRLFRHRFVAASGGLASLW